MDQEGRNDVLGALIIAGVICLTFLVWAIFSGGVLYSDNQSQRVEALESGE